MKCYKWMLYTRRTDRCEGCNSDADDNVNAMSLARTLSKCTLHYWKLGVQYRLFAYGCLSISQNFRENCQRVRWMTPNSVPEQIRRR